MTARQSSAVDRFSSELAAEIAYRVESFNEQDEADRDGQTIDESEVIKEMITEMDDRASFAYQHRKELEDYAINIGVYKGLTKDELSSIVSNGKKYDFKSGGLYYVFTSWDAI